MSEVHGFAIGPGGHGFALLAGARTVDFTLIPPAAEGGRWRIRFGEDLTEADEAALLAELPGPLEVDRGPRA